MPLANSPAHCMWSPFESKECQWYQMAVRALEQAGRRYRIVSTSSTVQALLAAAQAGLAVTHTLADDRLLEGLRPVRDEEGLPRLPECRYLMLKARESRQPATDTLAAQMRDVFRENADPAR